MHFIQMLKSNIYLAHIKRALLKNKLLAIFLLSVFLTQVYPFYLIPIPTSLFSSLTLGKIIIVALSFYFFAFKNKKVLCLVDSNKTVFSIIALFILGQSLSIINATDLLLFIKVYHNTLLSILIFYLSLLFISERKKVIHIITNFILITGIVFIFFEIIFRTFFNGIFPLIIKLFQKEIIDAYLRFLN